MSNKRHARLLGNVRNLYQDRQWKWCKGREGMYAISERGEIVSLVGKQPRMLRPSVDTQGYYSFGAKKLNGVKLTSRVHREVALTFAKRYKPGLTVNHKDGNKLNNHWSNLEWITLAENLKHAHRTGIYINHVTPIPPAGEASPHAKLTESAVRYIFAQRYTTITAKQLAARYDVHENTIVSIWIGKRWKHLRLNNTDQAA